MKKIALATLGLAMFATPLAADTPHSGYSTSGDRHVFGGTEFTPDAQTQSGRFTVTPSSRQVYGLTTGEPQFTGRRSGDDGYGPIHR